MKRGKVNGLMDISCSTGDNGGGELPLATTVMVFFVSFLFSCSVNFQQLIECTDLKQVKTKVSLRHRGGVLRGRDCLQVCFFGGIFQNELPHDEFYETDSFGSGTWTRFGKANSHLLDPFFRAGHRVVQAVVLVDDLPQLGEGVVLLQRVGAFSLEILEHGRIPHRPVNHIRLSGEILEGPADAPESVSASSGSIHAVEGRVW